MLIAIVYFANLVGLLPHSPDAVIPPDSRLADTPRYLRVIVLVALMLLAYAYAVAVERRLERRFATDARATILVSHLLLVLIALLLLLVDPYAVLLVLPAAILWPLARPGGWARSIFPVYLGLLMVPVPLIYYAQQLDVGWKVWWYFFLLFENRTIPAVAVLLAALFFSTAGVLAHTLHERGMAPGALVAGHRPAHAGPHERRGVGRRRGGGHAAHAARRAGAPAEPGTAQEVEKREGPGALLRASPAPAVSRSVFFLRERLVDGRVGLGVERHVVRTRHRLVAAVA